MYHRNGAAKTLRAQPQDCVVFEDSLNGVKAAKSAGMKCVAVPEVGDDASRYSDAEIVVKSLEEVDWKMLSKLWS